MPDEEGHVCVELVAIVKCADTNVQAEAAVADSYPLQVDLRRGPRIVVENDLLREGRDIYASAEGLEEGWKGG